MLLYIDPGTGFMLFTLLTGLISAAVYSVRLFLIKLQFHMGVKADINEEKVPYVFFSDNKRYWNIFEPICREMTRRGEEILYLTASEDDPVFSCDLEGLKAEYLGKPNKMFGRLNHLHACVVLSTTPGLDVYQWKRSPQADWYVHIPHAASEVVLYRMFGLDYYDAVLLSGQYQAEDIRALEEFRNMPAKELHIVGIPYMDEMAKRLRDSREVPAHSRTVLLAPSWGPSALLGVYGEKILEALVQTGYHIIVRPHPQSFQSEKKMIDKLMKAYPETANLEWNRDTDNFDVLNRSDILISDFSGVIFDFALIYDKPVIYTDPAFDLAPYDAWWLDRKYKKELWTVSALPRLGVMLTKDNLGDIKNLIDACISESRFTQGRNAVREETWQFMGEGAVRAADYLISRRRVKEETA